jgi:antitoxin component YwqK of YwqJK toxin-antitoxin module
VQIKEAYDNGLLNGTRLVYSQHGEKQVDETSQFGMGTGLVKNSYEDGKLLSESYSRGHRQHGLYTSYYPNGKIK